MCRLLCTCQIWKRKLQRWKPCPMLRFAARPINIMFHVGGHGRYVGDHVGYRSQSMIVGFCYEVRNRSCDQGRCYRGRIIGNNDWGHGCCSLQIYLRAKLQSMIPTWWMWKRFQPFCYKQETLFVVSLLLSRLQIGPWKTARISDLIYIFSFWPPLRKDTE